MPAWEDYKDEAKSRGALAMELFVVTSMPTGDPQAVRAALPDHLAYQKEREAAGDLFLAGPVSDETGARMEGAGMIVYRAASMEAARGLAEADPMHVAGARSFTVRKWLVNEGSFDLTLSLSGQTLRFG